MKMSKRNLLIFVTLFVSVLGLATVYDLDISMMLYDETKTNSFGVFFAAFGELPATLIMVFCSAAMIVTRNKSGLWKNAGSVIGFGLIMIMGSLMSGFIPTQYFEIPKLISSAITIFLPIISIFICSKIEKSYRKQLRIAATVGLIFVFLEMIIINVVKIFWGRERMRHMTDPINDFSPWFVSQVISVANDEFKSFPSGHSANAAAAFWILMLPIFIKGLKGKESLLFATAVTWTVMVMISRIIMGAHFLSDVTVGATIGMGCFFVVRRLVLQNNLD